MKKVPQSVVAFIFAAMQGKKRKEKRDSSKTMQQIRTMFVGIILVKCPATTHSPTFSPSSPSAMSCDTSDFV